MAEQDRNQNAPPRAASGSDAYLTGVYHRAVFSADPFVMEVLARRRTRKLQRLIRPEDSVFEYGVGTGLNLRFLDCRRRVGYDVSPASADHCRRFGIEPAADLAELDGQHFDVVLCHHVLEHLTDPLAALRTLQPLVAPSGRLLLYAPYEFNRRCRRYRPGDPNRHLFSWNGLTLGNLVTAAGFVVERTRLRAYGYEQRLAKFAKAGRATYRLALRLANLLRPCREIELVATCASSQ